MEKIKTDEGGEKPEGVRGRKRKASLKTDVRDESGEAVPPSEEVDPVTATIEAVLANASTLSAAFKKPKKLRRVKKKDQEVNPAETTADADDNDDDSSTAGNKEEEEEALFRHNIPV